LNGRPDDAPSGLVPVPTFRGEPSTPASDLSGVDPTGRPLEVRVLGVPGWHLVLFLSSGCEGCAEWWTARTDSHALGLSAGDAVIVVTKDPGDEDVATIGRLSAGSGPVVMSSAAWRAYRVHGPPFFVLVDGRDARVATEGVAWGVEHLAGFVRQARAGRRLVEAPHLSADTGEG